MGNRRFYIQLAVILGLLIVAPFVLTKYYRHFLTEILIWGLLAMALDLILGYTGIVSFGHDLSRSRAKPFFIGQNYGSLDLTWWNGPIFFEEAILLFRRNQTETVFLIEMDRPNRIGPRADQ